ncbi:MAG: MFS transporter [Actinomycetia bacterium]|nr:MFS transporter [Actinomycetes bacterium]
MTRNVTVLSAVSLAQDAASELLYPLLPILLTTILGAPAAVVGVVEGVAEGAAAVMKYLSGRWSDRSGRKPWIAVGYGLAAVGKVIVAAAAIWPVVLVGRVVDRTGKGIRGAPRDALLADGVEKSQLGRVFGFHRAADTLGAVIGPLVGLAVLTFAGGNIKVALWVAVVPAVLSVALVVLVREPARPEVAHRGVAPAAAGTAAPLAGGPLPPEFTRVVTVLTMIALVNFPDALVLLRLSEFGFSATGVVASYVLYNLVYTLVSYPAGALSDRLPQARVYALGLVCFAIGYVGLGLADNASMMVVLLCVYGGFNGFTDGVGKAWISGLVAPAVRGRAQGVFQGLMGGSVLVAGLWAGLAWQLGPGNGVVPLIIAGSVAAVAVPVVWIWGDRLSRSATLTPSAER